ncbi:MAG TPA: electron transfer flavoprotein subunit alpha/FixB family protein, partial [Burkholderiales bacterium]|nr:electron transfer flavoprotein subunit alpha/FixB family protein [Burkholderiales bacterium]
HVLGAAQKLGSDTTMLVIGDACRAVAEAAAGYEGLAKVLLCESPDYKDQSPEALAPFIAGIANAHSHVLLPAGSFGKNLAPRIAALLDVAQISDVIAIESADTFKRPIYAGNAIATVQSDDAIKVLTIRSTAFEAAKAGGSAPIETIAPGAPNSQSHVLSRETPQSERPELGGARVVVSGGRGLGSADAFKMLEQLADKLGAALGASRAAVDSGYVPNDWQVGQTGKIVAPELYIAVGISGAIQHLAGMKDSRIIVAINKDPEAPIFGVADYGLVGDLFEVVPQLIDALDRG